jgi:hypothetical protein
MKYKIIKKHSKTLKVTHTSKFPDSGKYMPEKTSIERSEWYEVKRKGRIFGFWHKVGHECGYEGERIQHTTHTLDEMKNYIRDWHEVHYGDKCKCEIIEKFEL